MYGTIAVARLKPGKEDELRQANEAFQARQVPGFVAEYTYRMDRDPNVIYMVAIFENKEAYVANAESPEQDADYRRMVELFEGPPEWHDGEIVIAVTGGA